MNRIDIARIQKDLRWQGFMLHLGQRLPEGTARVVDMQLKVFAEEELIDHVPVVLTQEATQQLMDDLWADGIRPTKQRDVAGEVEWLREQIGKIIAKEWG